MKFNRILFYGCAAACLTVIAVGCNNGNKSKFVDNDVFENEKPLPKNLNNFE